jgi:hypothetical protein
VELFTGFKAQPFTLQPIQNQITVVDNQGLGHVLFSWEYLPLRYLTLLLATFWQK